MNFSNSGFEFGKVRWEEKEGTTEDEEVATTYNPTILVSCVGVDAVIVQACLFWHINRDGESVQLFLITISKTGL